MSAERNTAREWRRALAHAKQELAQCAAVCIRAMEEVQKEMEKNNK